MSATLLLDGSAGLIGIAIALLALSVLTAARRDRDGPTGVMLAVQTIEQRYVRNTRETTEPSRPSALENVLRRLALRLSPSGVSASIQRRLDLAGNPSRWNTDRVLAAKGLGLTGLALLGILSQLSSVPRLLIWGAMGGVIGFFIPDVLLYNTGVKRQSQVERQLPDHLDMLTVSVEAGLSFDAALVQMTGKTRGPLAAEFTRVIQEMQIGKSRAEALRAMAERSTVPELRTLVFSLVQAGELGIPMAQVLREQAREMRIKRRQRAEEKAQQLSVKILFPLIVCLFPALMIVVIGPGLLNIVHTLFHGSL
jgi:tight adherence protein C